MNHNDDQRRRDERDALNREQDRQDFERMQRDRTSAAYEGIREKDELKVRSALDLPLDGVGFDSSQDDEQVLSLPTAGAQFNEHSRKLLFQLQWSEALPETLRKEWAESVAQLDIERPATSLAILARVSESYQRAGRVFAPPLTELSHAMRWEEQVPRIGHEINWLIDILNHVLALSRH